MSSVYHRSDLDVRKDGKLCCATHRFLLCSIKIEPKVAFCGLYYSFAVLIESAMQSITPQVRLWTLHPWSYSKAAWTLA